MEDISSRFWSKVSIGEENECWEWQAAMYRGGYGAFRGRDGRMSTAHRTAYQLEKGEIPERYVIYHSCDNRKCVNPSHLFCGTQQDNIDDMWKKGRAATGKQLNHVSQAGEFNHAARITREQALMVLYLYRHGYAQADIACQTDVSRSNVWCIVHRRSWIHLGQG